MNEKKIYRLKKLATRKAFIQKHLFEKKKIAKKHKKMLLKKK